MADWNWGKFILIMGAIQIAKYLMGDSFHPIFFLAVAVAIVTLFHGKLMLGYQTYVLLALVVFILTYFWMDMALVLTQILTYLIYLFIAVGIIGWIHNKFS